MREPKAVRDDFGQSPRFLTQNATMYLFQPYPGDVRTSQVSSHTTDWLAGLVTVEGGHADRPQETKTNAADSLDQAAARPPWLCKAHEYLDIARRLAGELAPAPAAAGPQPAEAGAMARALRECEAGFDNIETAMARLDRLREAVPALASGPRAFRMFDHVQRRHEAALKQACSRTFEALGGLQTAIGDAARHHNAEAPAGTAGPVVPALHALHQVIAAAKGLVAMIMAALMAPDRLGHHPPAHGPATSAPATSDLEHAAAALREVRQQCADMRAALLDAEPGDDPDFGSAPDDEPEAGDADRKIRSFFAMFELVNLIEDAPPPGKPSPQELRLRATKLPVPAHMTMELAQALEATIARYPRAQQEALQQLYALAFPERAAAAPAPDAAPVLTDPPADEPVPAAVVAAEPAPEALAEPASRSWRDAARAYLPLVALALLYRTMSMM